MVSSIFFVDLLVGDHIGIVIFFDTIKGAKLANRRYSTFV